MITRRKCLSLSAVALAAAMAPGLLVAKQRQPQMAWLGRFTKAKFQALLRTRFSISQGGSDRSEVTLVKVTDGPVFAGTEQFSITFKGRRSSPLPEGLYDIRHARMGSFQLHLRPVGSDQGVVYYSATFNLLV